MSIYHKIFMYYVLWCYQYRAFLLRYIVSIFLGHPVARQCFQVQQYLLFPFYCKMTLGQIYSFVYGNQSFSERPSIERRSVRTLIMSERERKRRSEADRWALS